MRLDLGLLFLRVTVGLMMAGHGIGKVADLFAGKTGFPDPLGIGPVPSLALAAFAEFFCSLLVIVGLKTRWAALPVVVTMLVAALIIHADDPWQKKEFALLFAASFFTLALTGGGRYALDAVFARRRRRKR